MHKNLPFELLSLMADQKVHSGEEIGRSLGLSRAAVWKQVQKIGELGIGIESLRGQGYRMIDKLDLLDCEVLKESLLSMYGLQCEVFDEIDSTNTQMLRYLQRENDPGIRCIIAERQSAGRGRRGRCWVSPFGKSLNFSLLWSFEAGIMAIEGLSLVVGISIADLLCDLNVSDVRLKWPNDVLVHNRKVAGILLELHGEPTGVCNVVIGVGLNVYKPVESAVVIDQPWTTLDMVYDLSINRTELMIRLIDRLMVNIAVFERQGLSAFVDAWKQYDAYFDRDVVLLQGEQMIFGKAAGIGKAGELLLITQQGIRSFNSGEVSLRLKN